MKYYITKPVKGGYAYYDVRLPDGPLGQNSSMVSISKYTLHAAELARELCDRLNGARTG